MTDQEKADRVVAAMLDRDAFSAWLGVTVERMEPGVCEASMIVRDDMMNGFGVAHGGVAYSLADSVMAFASNARGRVAMALTNTMSYPKPVKAGDVLRAVARELYVTRRTAGYDVEVSRDGVPVALFRGTVFITDHLHELDNG